MSILFQTLLCLCFRVNLVDFADVLIRMGVKNAINTDGGGSATLIVNDTVVSHPSDYRCVTWQLRRFSGC